MSDVTRQVGGALGVAVIGSIIRSAYSADMDGVTGPAHESVGAAHGVAQQIGGATGRDLSDAALVALAGAVLVLLRLPSGRTPATTRPATA